MKIIQGLAGPKAMAKAETDGQPVNIPAPSSFFNGVSKNSIKSGLLDFRFWREERLQANPQAGVMPGSNRWENSFEQSLENSLKHSS